MGKSCHAIEENVEMTLLSDVDWVRATSVILPKGKKTIRQNQSYDDRIDHFVA